MKLFQVLAGALDMLGGGNDNGNAETNFGIAGSGVAQSSGIGSRPSTGGSTSASPPPTTSAVAKKSVPVTNATIATLATQLNIAIGVLSSIDSKLTEQNNTQRIQDQQIAKQQKETLLEGGPAGEGKGGLAGRTAESVKKIAQDLQSNLVAMALAAGGTALASLLGKLFGAPGSNPPPGDNLGGGNDYGPPNERFLNYAKKNENFQGKVYDDEGNPAIGYGHNINAADIKRGGLRGLSGKTYLLKGQGGKDTTMSEEQAADVLQMDIKEAKDLARNSLGSNVWSKLNEDQKNAIASLVMNMGIGNFNKWSKNVGFKKALEEGRYNDAAEMIRTKGPVTGAKTGEVYPGLQRRRKEEAELFLGRGPAAMGAQASQPQPQARQVQSPTRDGAVMRKDETGRAVTAVTGAGTTGISSAVGSRSAPQTAQGPGSKNHAGYDITGALKTPVKAIAAGIVERAGFAQEGSGYFGYGYIVLIYHDKSGFRTLYGHLFEGSIDVKPGDTVSRGQKIGGMGSTGKSTGSHLHFSVIDPNGKYVDPTPFLKNPGLLDSAEMAKGAAVAIKDTKRAAVGTAPTGTSTSDGLTKSVADSDVVIDMFGAGSMAEKMYKGEGRGFRNPQDAQPVAKPSPTTISQMAIEGDKAEKPRTFEEVFQAARKAAGDKPDGKFTFNGQEYQTNLPTEQEKPLSQLTNVDGKIAQYLPPPPSPAEKKKKADAKKVEPVAASTDRDITVTNKDVNIASPSLASLSPQGDINTDMLRKILKPSSTTSAFLQGIQQDVPNLENPAARIETAAIDTARTPVQQGNQIVKAVESSAANPSGIVVNNNAGSRRFGRMEIPNYIVPDPSIDLVAKDMKAYFDVGRHA